MDLGPLRIDLERAALHALHDEWDSTNHFHFNGAMRPPTLLFAEREKTLGRWISARRAIELDRRMVFEQPWTVVREVLLHEMAHQFVDEVLGKREESAHGPAFRQVCRERGIDARASGAPEPAAPGKNKLIERVGKLLALATSANEHEAHTAMNAAQRLMLEHNLADVSAKDARRYVSRALGEPTGRLEGARSRIGTVLAEHFFVRALELRVWIAKAGRPGTVIEVTGTPENVEMADYVYAFLDRTADRLWAEHKRARGIRGDRERRAFRVGVVLGFSEKLRQEQRGNVERGLVWVGDPELDAHYRRKYPRILTVSRGGTGSAEARESGRAAGRTVVLSRPVEGGAGGGRGLLLGDGT